MSTCRGWTQRNQPKQTRHLIQVKQAKEEYGEDQILSTTGLDIFELFLQTEAGRASKVTAKEEE
jgi:hypothetical protein